jgi:hypothetical protein
VRGNWQWIIAGAAGIVIGLAVWVTAFVLVPVGATLIVVGIVKSTRRARA